MRAFCIEAKSKAAAGGVHHVKPCSAEPFWMNTGSSPLVSMDRVSRPISSAGACPHDFGPSFCLTGSQTQRFQAKHYRLATQATPSMVIPGEDPWASLLELQQKHLAGLPTVTRLHREVWNILGFQKLSHGMKEPSDLFIFGVTFWSQGAVQCCALGDHRRVIPSRWAAEGSRGQQTCFRLRSTSGVRCPNGCGVSLWRYGCGSN